MSGSGEQFVHFIRRKDDEGPIAIGSSPDPQHALAILQLGNPEELRLLGVVDANRYPEAWWHDTLSPWHIRGLWYEAKAQVTCRMEDALRGALDDPSLPPLPDPALARHEPAQAEPDVLPADLRERLVQAEERARQQIRDKWAWPEVDPYPVPVPSLDDEGQRQTLPARALRLLTSCHCPTGATEEVPTQIPSQDPILEPPILQNEAPDPTPEKALLRKLHRATKCPSVAPDR